MTTFLYAACCIGGWMLIVTGLLLANHRVHSRPKPRAEPVDPFVDREGTRYLPTYPPKVYPTRPADLLSDQPAEVAPSEWSRQFFAIVDRETHWFMDGAA